MKHFALVVAGGTAGTLARYGVDEWLGTSGTFPAATFAVNVTGSFLLGALLTVLALRGDDTGPRRGLRLALGTGFLGGYTTYSALAVETQTLLRDGHAPMALTYAVATVVAGLVAALAGIMAARAVAR